MRRMFHWIPRESGSVAGWGQPPRTPALNGDIVDISGHLDRVASGGAMFVPRYVASFILYIYTHLCLFARFVAFEFM